MRTKTIKNFPQDSENYKLSGVINEEVHTYSFEIQVDKKLEWDPKDWHPIETAHWKTASIKPYIPSSRTSEAIELAQALERPILLQGEPGSGKTKLAEAIAYDWYGEKYLSKYFEWHVKSNSKAIDGIYTFDHIARLRDAHLAGKATSIKKTTINDLSKYLQLGPLGKAFLASTEEEPAILLIDEIDKADIDFPNDLLLEIDEKRSRIVEPGIADITIEAERAPLILITSNQEKELSPAFLRRCLYLYFQFPKEAILRQIIHARHPGLKTDEDLATRLIARFQKLRNEMKDNPNINRMASTSEFLDWVQAIEYSISRNKKEDVENIIDQLKFSTTLLKNLEELKMQDLFFKSD
mgnify:CR=1 FL=1